MLHTGFGRSLHARARIGTTRAPGVTLIPAADLAGRARPVPLLVPPGVEVADAAHPLLADGEVRYVGQPGAAGAGRTRGAARGAPPAPCRRARSRPRPTRGRPSPWPAWGGGAP